MRWQKNMQLIDATEQTFGLTEPILHHQRPPALRQEELAADFLRVTKKESFLRRRRE